ncbi:YdcF family protein [Sphingopyxis yananensis]|uniref:YdcF family protein n=1 Tax=Sphingopyxis yananensis TaxID=2886687 RepID=UPI001D101F82|nr:YdcF family protein [Sphingopyxis yananensis]MCC2601309.1 YdcF family protein [Sphingopyxis yananensis]
MIKRLISLLFLAWVLGFAWFALLPPMPAPLQKTDAIVVLTGGPGRIDRALDLLEQKQADRLLISGVAREVKPHELAAEYKRPMALFDCCVALGFEAEDTRSNATEVVNWVARRNYRTVRLVTTDWHMRRAEFELRRAIDKNVTIIPDAVRSQPNFLTLFREYHKYLAGLVGGLIGV